METGFTYLSLMILVATLALATSATLTLGSIVQRRQAEQQLLEVGAAYRRAIASYLNSSPGGRRSYPPTLTDLLKDPRYPGVRRHLRRLYPDPMTGKAEWGLVPAPGGGIMGIHSLSEARAIKLAGFEAENQLFEGKVRYSEWIFVVQSVAPGIGTGVPRQTPGASAGATSPNPTPQQVPGGFAAQSPAPVELSGTAQVPARGLFPTGAQH
ncbi:MAG: type II secretion system protein [Candidatus Accumulibacter sp.]|uniref:type II secretion system protein n=1 Tax=Accumulibacter sp. TaxID=2053492 RepID=UPI00287B4657|nr:type II secretion system protein [Accumulibacter sp.]MDS4016332.1 type II secretion system protein [Accumulibacter sp.]